MEKFHFTQESKQWPLDYESNTKLIGQTRHNKYSLSSYFCGTPNSAVSETNSLNCPINLTYVFQFLIVLSTIDMYDVFHMLFYKIYEHFSVYSFYFYVYCKQLVPRIYEAPVFYYLETFKHSEYLLKIHVFETQIIPGAADLIDFVIFAVIDFNFSSLSSIFLCKKNVNRYLFW